MSVNPSNPSNYIRSFRGSYQWGNRRSSAMGSNWPIGILNAQPGTFKLWLHRVAVTIVDAGGGVVNDGGVTFSLRGVTALGGGAVGEAGRMFPSIYPAHLAEIRQPAAPVETVPVTSFWEGRGPAKQVASITGLYAAPVAPVQELLWSDLILAAGEGVVVRVDTVSLGWTISADIAWSEAT